MASIAVRRAAAQMNQDKAQELLSQMLSGDDPSAGGSGDSSDPLAGMGMGVPGASGMGGAGVGGVPAAPGMGGLDASVQQALGQYITPGASDLPPWNSTTNGLGRSALNYDLSAARRVGFDPSAIRANNAKSFADAERRMAAAGLSPASRQWVRDRIALGLGALGADPSGKDVSKIFDTYTSDAALANMADMDKAARSISGGIAQAEAPINEQERDYRTKQAAMQAAIAPRVSQLVAANGGENGVVGKMAQALAWKQAAEAPDFASARIKARDQILNDPTIAAARQGFLGNNAQRNSDMTSAMQQYLAARMGDVAGVVQPLRLGSSQNQPPNPNPYAMGN